LNAEIKAAFKNKEATYLVKSRLNLEF